MLIILEGLDKCGKTTFAKKLGNCVLKHSTKDDDALAVLKKYVNIADEQLVVLDRSFLSEMTYGQVYRGVNTITAAKLMQIKRILSKIPHIILYFYRPNNEIANYDANDEFESEPDKLMKVKALYEKYITMYKNTFNIYKIRYVAGVEVSDE